MKLYWGLGSIPELHALPAGQRGRFWRPACRAAQRRPRARLAMMIPMLLVGLSLTAGRAIATDGASWAVVIVLATVAGGVGGFVYGQIVTREARPYLRRALEAEDASPSPRQEAGRVI